VYGVKPSDITHMSHLRNAEVIQVCVGQYDLQFNFHPTGNVSVQGRCELLDDSAKLIDVREDWTRSSVFRFLAKIGVSSHAAARHPETMKMESALPIVTAVSSGQGRL
jgi:hypothetical protein